MNVKCQKNRRKRAKIKRQLQAYFLIKPDPLLCVVTAQMAATVFMYPGKHLLVLNIIGQLRGRYSKLEKT